MGSTITYILGNSLYINITNRCTNSCTFCVRNLQSGVSEEIDLWLDKEPSIEEIITDIQKRNLNDFEKIVFCGYGEPMLRAFDIVEVCKYIRRISNLPIKINTNGQGNLYFNKDITPDLSGLVDIVSISLNAKQADEYQKLCNSRFGQDAFAGIMDFAVKCKKHVPKVVFTVVDVLDPEDLQECEKIAKDLGVDFRIRPLGV